MKLYKVYQVEKDGNLILLCTSSDATYVFHHWNWCYRSTFIERIKTLFGLNEGKYIIREEVDNDK